jgi:hypothetical protein
MEEDEDVIEAGAEFVGKKGIYEQVFHRWFCGNKASLHPFPIDLYTAPLRIESQASPSLLQHPLRTERSKYSSYCTAGLLRLHKSQVRIAIQALHLERCGDIREVLLIPFCPLTGTSDGICAFGVLMARGVLVELPALGVLPSPPPNAGVLLPTLTLVPLFFILPRICTCSVASSNSSSSMCSVA